MEISVKDSLCPIELNRHLKLWHCHIQTIIDVFDALLKSVHHQKTLFVLFLIAILLIYITGYAGKGTASQTPVTTHEITVLQQL